MAQNATGAPGSPVLNGLFVRGVVVSSSARVFNRKDGSGKFVCVRHEVALDPGLAVYEEYPDPAGGQVKLEGDSVVAFPTLPKLETVTLKVLGWKEQNGQMVIKRAERVV